MPTGHPQENAIGVPIVVTVVENDGITPVDLSTATIKQLIIKRPDGSKLTKDVGFPQGHNGSDGQLEYDSIDGDLVPFGTFGVQAYVVRPDKAGKTSVDYFYVLQNL